MKLLGFALLVLMWTVLVIGTLNWLWEWRRDRHLVAYEEGVKFIPLLIIQETFRKAR